MKVSVLMFVYNQELYIAEAIESALKQKTDFPYEIVIGDDCSTDGTRKIVMDYGRRYPEKIRLVLQPKNLGLMGNFLETFKVCRGNYIMELAGDDYWTDRSKMQKQVVFLDAHPDFSLCFHNVITVGGKTENLLCPPGQKGVSGLEDILEKNFIPAVSVLFRKKAIGDFPDWYRGLAFEDWPLFVLCAEHGKIGYLSEVMAAYRQHGASVTGSAHNNLEKFVRHIKCIIDFYNAVDKHLSFRYSALIHKQIAAYRLLLAQRCFKTDKRQSWSYLKESFFGYPNIFWPVLAAKRLIHLLVD